MNKLMPLMIALALLAVPATVTAQEAGSSEQVETSEDEATISYDREIGDLSTALEISFTTQDATFEVHANATGEHTQFDKDLKTQLHQLVEFEDENNNGKYDEGEPVVTSYMLSSGSDQRVSGPGSGTVEWEDLETTDATAEDGTPGTRIIARGELPPQSASEELPDELPDVGGAAENRTNGTVGIDIYVFGAGAVYNGTTLDPSEVKIDFTVKDYPYAQNDTQVALIQETETTSQDQAAQPEDGQGVQGTHDVRDVRVGMLYAWSDEAEVDGSDEPVRTTVLENETQEKSTGSEDGKEYQVQRAHALTYQRGDLIVHDPRTGVVLSPTSVGGTLDKTAEEVPGMTAIGALAAFGAAVAVAARRR